MIAVEFGDGITWRKSSRSADQGGNCVCVAADGDRTGIRDSKEGQAGAVLWVGTSDWAALRAHLTS